jgi:hypothetical protein
MKNPKDKKLDKLSEYFNSPIGLLHGCKSDSKTKDIILYYNKFSLAQVRDSLQMLKETISAFDVLNDVESISILKSKDKMRLPLKKQIRIIREFVDRNAKQFIGSSNIQVVIISFMLNYLKRYLVDKWVFKPAVQ